MITYIQYWRIEEDSIITNNDYTTLRGAIIQQLRMDWKTFIGGIKDLDKSATVSFQHK